MLTIEETSLTRQTSLISKLPSITTIPSFSTKSTNAETVFTNKISTTLRMTPTPISPLLTTTSLITTTLTEQSLSNKTAATLISRISNRTVFIMSTTLHKTKPTKMTSPALSRRSTMSTSRSQASMYSTTKPTSLTTVSPEPPTTTSVTLIKATRLSTPSIITTSKSQARHLSLTTTPWTVKGPSSTKSVITYTRTLTPPRPFTTMPTSFYSTFARTTSHYSRSSYLKVSTEIPPTTTIPPSKSGLSSIFISSKTGNLRTVGAQISSVSNFALSTRTSVSTPARSPKISSFSGSFSFRKTTALTTTPCTPKRSKMVTTTTPGKVSLTMHTALISKLSRLTTNPSFSAGLANTKTALTDKILNTFNMTPTTNSPLATTASHIKRTTTGQSTSTEAAATLINMTATETVFFMSRTLNKTTPTKMTSPTLIRSSTISFSWTTEKPNSATLQTYIGSTRSPASINLTKEPSRLTTVSTNSPTTSSVTLTTPRLATPLNTTVSKSQARHLTLTTTPWTVKGPSSTKSVISYTRTLTPPRPFTTMPTSFYSTFARTTSHYSRSSYLKVSTEIPPTTTIPPSKSGLSSIFISSKTGNLRTVGAQISSVSNFALSTRTSVSTPARSPKISSFSGSFSFRKTTALTTTPCTPKRSKMVTTTTPGKVSLTMHTALISKLSRLTTNPSFSAGLANTKTALTDKILNTFNMTPTTNSPLATTASHIKRTTTGQSTSTEAAATLINMTATETVFFMSRTLNKTTQTKMTSPTLIRSSTISFSWTTEKPNSATLQTYIGSTRSPASINLTKEPSRLTTVSTNSPTTSSVTLTTPRLATPLNTTVSKSQARHLTLTTTPWTVKGPSSTKSVITYTRTLTPPRPFTTMPTSFYSTFAGTTSHYSRSSYLKISTKIPTTPTIPPSNSGLSSIFISSKTGNLRTVGAQISSVSSFALSTRTSVSTPARSPKISSFSGSFSFRKATALTTTPCTPKRSKMVTTTTPGKVSLTMHTALISKLSRLTTNPSFSAGLANTKTALTDKILNTFIMTPTTNSPLATTASQIKRTTTAQSTSTEAAATLINMTATETIFFMSKTLNKTTPTKMTSPTLIRSSTISFSWTTEKPNSATLQTYIRSTRYPASINLTKEPSSLTTVSTNSPTTSSVTLTTPRLATPLNTTVSKSQARHLSITTTPWTVEEQSSTNSVITYTRTLTPPRPFTTMPTSFYSTFAGTTSHYSRSSYLKISTEIPPTTTIPPSKSGLSLILISSKTGNLRTVVSQMSSVSSSALSTRTNVTTSAGPTKISSRSSLFSTQRTTTPCTQKTLKIMTTTFPEETSLTMQTTLISKLPSITTNPLFSTRSTNTKTVFTNKISNTFFMTPATISRLSTTTSSIISTSTAQSMSTEAAKKFNLTERPASPTSTMDHTFPSLPPSTILSTQPVDLLTSPSNEAAPLLTKPTMSAIQATKTTYSTIQSTSLTQMSYQLSRKTAFATNSFIPTTLLSPVWTVLSRHASSTLNTTSASDLTTKSVSSTEGQLSATNSLSKSTILLILLTTKAFTFTSLTPVSLQSQTTLPAPSLVGTSLTGKRDTFRTNRASAISQPPMPSKTQKNSLTTISGLRTPKASAFSTNPNKSASPTANSKPTYSSLVSRFLHNKRSTSTTAVSTAGVTGYQSMTTVPTYCCSAVLTTRPFMKQNSSRATKPQQHSTSNSSPILTIPSILLTNKMLFTTTLSWPLSLTLTSRTMTLPTPTESIESKGLFSLATVTLMTPISSPSTKPFTSTLIYYLTKDSKTTAYTSAKTSLSNTEGIHTNNNTELSNHSIVHMPRTAYSISRSALPFTTVLITENNKKALTSKTTYAGTERNQDIKTKTSITQPGETMNKKTEKTFRAILGRQSTTNFHKKDKTTSVSSNAITNATAESTIPIKTGSKSKLPRANSYQTPTDKPAVINSLTTSKAFAVFTAITSFTSLLNIEIATPATVLFTSILPEKPSDKTPRASLPTTTKLFSIVTRSETNTPSIRSMMVTQTTFAMPRMTKTETFAPTSSDTTASVTTNQPTVVSPYIITTPNTKEKNRSIVTNMSTPKVTKSTLSITTATYATRMQSWVRNNTSILIPSSTKIATQKVTKHATTEPPTFSTMSHRSNIHITDIPPSTAKLTTADRTITIQATVFENNGSQTQRITQTESFPRTSVDPVATTSLPNFSIRIQPSSSTGTMPYVPQNNSVRSILTKPVILVTRQFLNSTLTSDITLTASLKSSSINNAITNTPITIAEVATPSIMRSTMPLVTQVSRYLGDRPFTTKTSSTESKTIPGRWSSSKLSSPAAILSTATLKTQTAPASESEAARTLAAKSRVTTSSTTIAMTISPASTSIMQTLSSTQPPIKTSLNTLLRSLTFTPTLLTVKPSVFTTPSFKSETIRTLQTLPTLLISRYSGIFTKPHKPTSTKLGLISKATANSTAILSMTTLVTSLPIRSFSATLVRWPTTTIMTLIASTAALFKTPTSSTRLQTTTETADTSKILTKISTKSIMSSTTTAFKMPITSTTLPVTIETSITPPMAIVTSTLEMIPTAKTSTTREVSITAAQSATISKSSTIPTKTISATHMSTTKVFSSATKTVTTLTMSTTASTIHKTTILSTTTITTKATSTLLETTLMSSTSTIIFTSISTSLTTMISTLSSFTRPIKASITTIGTINISRTMHIGRILKKGTTTLMKPTTTKIRNEEKGENEKGFFEETANIVAVSTVAGVAGLGATALISYALLSRLQPNRPTLRCVDNIRQLLNGRTKPTLSEQHDIRRTNENQKNGSVRLNGKQSTSPRKLKKTQFAINVAEAEQTLNTADRSPSINPRETTSVVTENENKKIEGCQSHVKDNYHSKSLNDETSTTPNKVNKVRHIRFKTSDFMNRPRWH